MRKLERQELTTKYSEVIEEQKAAGVVEGAEKPAVSREFYIPHKPVVRAEAESTKLRVVYDNLSCGSHWRHTKSVSASASERR